MPDAHKNFAGSLVATAPSPATSGTSLVVTTGDGTKFPAAPFNATIWPAGATPSTANAEIVRVTAVSTDTLTITRAQESTSARTVIVGDQIVASITAQTLTDAETAAAPSLRDTYMKLTAAGYETVPPWLTGISATALQSGRLYLFAIALPAGYSVGRIGFWSAATAAASPLNWWFGLYDSSRVQLALSADQTTTAWAANTSQSLPIATTGAGAASSFVTTYSGLHYLGMMMKATTAVNLLSGPASINNAVTTTPVLVGHTDTLQTTPPAFPHTAATFNISISSVAYGWVAP